MEERSLTDRNTPKPSFFSPETGIYSSTHKPRALPQDPFQDSVSFIFSHEHRGEIALVDSLSGFSMSYAELRGTVRSMASGLSQVGISRGDVVLMLLPNTILFPVILLGVLSIGAVVTTMNPMSSPEEIRKTDYKFVFTVSENIAKLDGLDVQAVVVPDSMNYDRTEFSLFDGLLSSDPRVAPQPLIRQRDTAAILFSSGTSGPSKGVVITHGNFIAMVELFARAEQYLTESWKTVHLAAIPMFHVYGLSVFTMGLLAVGSTVVVMRRFDAEEAARAIERYRVTHFPVVPPMLRSLVRVKSTTSCDFGSLIQVSCGAAPLSEQFIQEFVETYPHVDFIQGYGMTESTAVGARGFNTPICKKHMSAGLLAPNMQAKVVEWKTGSCLPPGITGELWLRGPAIMKGYLNNERATLSTIVEDGWLRTGDIAYFDQDGYLFIVDRLKDTIKYKGFQIAPADLEALLISHPEVIDVAVTSAQDEEAGEIPVAYIVRRPGSALSSAEVLEYVAKKVAPYKKVRKVVFLNSIPKSAAGKILRRMLRTNHRASKM